MYGVTSLHNCNYDQRCENPNCCIHDNSPERCSVYDWNNYCSKCIYGNQNIGICNVIGKGNILFSNGFAEKKEYLLLCKKQADAEYVATFMNPRFVEKICFSYGCIEDFSFLEKFPNLRELRIDSSKLTHFSWDLEKTANLEVLSIEGKNLFNLAGLEKAKNLHVFAFTIATSRMDRQDIKSLLPISKLPKLEEVEIQGARLQDENIEHLISIPKLKKLFVSPDTYSLESFAKFEAKKFKINEEYGCYISNNEEIWKYGNNIKSRRIKRDNPKKIEEYLAMYHALMDQYKK